MPGDPGPSPGSGEPVSIPCLLGLGSNLGDRLGHLQRAVDLLGATAGVRVVGASRVYETEPVGGPQGQPDFLNAVVRVETTLSPRGLLDACLGVERDIGRRRGVRWGPRVIDVDLLTYGDVQIDEPDLQVPHPRMHQRVFVLAPMLELEDGYRPRVEGIDDPDVAELAGVRLFDARLDVPPRPDGE